MTSTAAGTTPDAGEPTGRARPSRWAALLIALGVALVLALGWALDGLGALAPTTRFASGQSQQAGLYRVSLALAPTSPHAGDITKLDVRVTDTTGAVMSTARVQLSLIMPAMEMAPVALATTPDGQGGYAATTSFPMSGAWAVTIQVTPPGAATVQTTFHIAVR